MQQEIEIVFDPETWYYDCLLLSKWIATQGKTLDELIKNLNEAIKLSKEKTFNLYKFKISFEENYVNI
jgi:hypothetical protein